jgi:ankyrin repeat protein
MNETALHRAAAHGTRQECEVLLNTRGTDINAKDDWNATPLHYAASKNKVDIVDLLLRHGASVNARMTTGETPLGTALTQLQRGHYVGFGDNPTPPQVIVWMLRSYGGVE